MSQHILITGGAGFVGSHLADELLSGGYRVRVLDSLSPQVHGPGRHAPEYLSPDVELIVGDVRDPEAVRQALEGVDAVSHLAAAVGVGQGMYEIAHDTDVNNLGTAVLLEALSANPVRRLIVASSMSLYGEGLCRTEGGCLVTNASRSLEQLKAHDWEVCGPNGHRLTPLPPPATKAPARSAIRRTTGAGGPL